ncbi:MAG: NAD+ synthase [Planctomycetota bacterium]
MKIGICQINTTVGDFAGNRRRIEEAARQAHQQGAQLAVFPELVLCGYPPEDLLLKEAFTEAHDRCLAELAANLPPDLPALVGCLTRNEERDRGGRPLHNAVALVEDGLARVVSRKCLLPTYDIFDESRFFEPWTQPETSLVELGGKKIGVLVCEDGWNDEEFFTSRRYTLDPMKRVVAAGAELVINLSASPWALGREEFRYRMLHAASTRHGVPIVYVNQVGGNVALQFDGASMAVKPGGLAFQPIHFEECIEVVDTAAPWEVVPRFAAAEEMHQAALAQGIRDYCRKFGFDKCLVGLSGGIDSAVTAVLAVDAIGSENVVGIAMPSTFSSEHSVEDANALAHNLGIRMHNLPIASLQAAYDTALEPVFTVAEHDVTEENLQARMRGTLLMAYANKLGHLLLSTGNKSEAAVGYCTLYGDMCGGLAVIADLWKTEVYALARWLNRNGERIPQNTIKKPPSAELRPDQKDSDTLPPYEVLDPILKVLVEDEMGVEAAARRIGADPDLVRKLANMVQRSEFKRFQSAPTLRVSLRCWVGRRVPVAHRFEE